MKVLSPAHQAHLEYFEESQKPNLCEDSPCWVLVLTKQSSTFSPIGFLAIGKRIRKVPLRSTNAFLFSDSTPISETYSRTYNHLLFSLRTEVIKCTNLV